MEPEQTNDDEAKPTREKQGDAPWDEHCLTIRQRAFIAALIGPAAGNATKAIGMAGLRPKGSYKTRSDAAVEMLNKPHIQAAIARALSQRFSGPEWTQSRLLELSRSSMANFLTIGKDGEPKLDMKKAIEAGAMGQLAQLSYDQNGNPKIKIFDPISALTTLAKIQGMLRDNGAEPERDVLLTNDPALVSASPPPGAIPSLPRPDPVQGLPSGEAVGQDGNGQAQVGDEQLGNGPSAPAEPS